MNFPAVHEAHTPTPMKFLNLPAAHAVHESLEVAGRSNPTLQCSCTLKEHPSWGVVDTADSGETSL